MARLRTLKGLATALANTFISRNNDVLGYWALGLLYLEAKECAQLIQKITLFGDGDEPLGAASSLVAAHYQRKLCKWAASHGVRLASATVVISFQPYGSIKPPTWFHFGDPFGTVFTLEDSAGRVALAERSGLCRPHDATREWRSSRWVPPS